MAGETVLLIDDDGAEERATGLRQAAGDLGLVVRVSRGGDELVACLREAASGDEPAAVVLGPALPRAVAAARLVYRLDPLVQMVFVADSARAAELRREMGLAPRIGTHWSIADPAGLTRSLQEAIRSTRQRRQTRTTLDRLKVQVAARPAADSADYRKLVVSDRFLASILGYAQDAILSIDPAGTIVTWNPAAARLFGLAEADAVGRPINLLDPDPNTPAVSGLVREVADGAPEVRREVRLRRADGSPLDAEVTLAPVLDKTGRLLAVSVIARDVSERRRAEEAVRQQREWLRVTLTSIGDAVIATDTRGRVTFLNPVAEALTGWSQEDAEGRPLDEVFVIVNEQTRRPAEHPVARVLREGAVVGLANHTLLISRDGTERPIDDSAAPIRDASYGLNGVVLIFRDVTEQRRAEAELRESEAKLRLLADTIPQLAWMARPDGHIFWYNRRWYEYTGTTPDQMEGWGWQSVHDPETLPTVLERWKASIASGEPFDMVFPLRGADGQFRPFLTRVNPLRGEHGRILYWFGTNTDISEQKRATDTSRFLAGASATLAALTDYESTLRRVAEVAVPFFADWCVVDLAEADGLLRRLAVAHVDPAKVELIHELRRRYPPRPTDPHGPQNVLRTGQPEMAADIPDAVLTAVAQDEDHLHILRGLGLRSYICVPLAARGRTLGVLTFVTAESGRAYGPDDLRLAEDLAQRVALAVDNATLYTTAQDALRQKEESLALLDTLQHNAPVGFAFVDRQFRYVRMNEALAAIDGNSPEYHLGRTVQETVPKLWPKLEPLYRGVLEGGEPVINREVTGETPAAPGQARHWLVNYYPVRAHGEVVGVGILVADITLQKQAEAALRESEAYFRDLTQNMPLVVWTNLPDGRVDFVNRRWLEMTGQTLEYVRSAPEAWMVALHPDDRERAEKAYLDGVRCGDGFTMEARFRRASDGQYRWHLNRAVPLRDVAGNVVKFLGTCTDIEDHKRLEADLRDADRRKDEFLATLAHELRNPLAPIRNSLQILKMPRVDAATARQAREMMERQVHHLVRLVDDLLDVSRVMRGKIELRREPVELATVVARAVETAKPLIEVQGHELDISLPPESLLLDADPVRLAQVVGNLLTNAAKYTEANGHMWLTAEREGGEAVLRVRDNGIGIAPDLLPHVFELFVQADHSSTKAHGGLGIGLTLVRNLVQMHGGSVEAHSGGSGQGSEFVVRLPLLVQERQDQPEEGDRQHRQEPARASGYRLMVVDDNKDAAVSLAMLLRLQGHEVRVAHDGPSALELAVTFRPQLVFLDIGMPGMDGYEVARRLRQQPGLENVVLAALTGWGQQEDRRRSAEAGFDHHLVKPSEPKALGSVLDELRRRV